MTMNLIPGVESTGSALSAEKIRLEVIAQNIANSNTTQDASGKVYQRKEVAFEEFIKTPDRRTPGYVFYERMCERQSNALTNIKSTIVNSQLIEGFRSGRKSCNLSNNS